MVIPQYPSQGGSYQRPVGDTSFHLEDGLVKRG